MSEKYLSAEDFLSLIRQAEHEIENDFSYSDAEAEKMVNTWLQGQIAQAVQREREAARGLGEWQPIETAPKDLSCVLVGYWEDCSSQPTPQWFTYVAAYQRVDFDEPTGSPARLGWMPIGFGGYGEEHELQPTHWMTLPTPPATYNDNRKV
jgi:hypothetical protein